MDSPLELLNPNKELLSKSHPKNDPSNYNGTHITVLKPSSSTKYDSTKREDAILLSPRNHHRAYISRNSSKIESEYNDEKTVLPTQIVVLKPNPNSYPFRTLSSRSKDSSHDKGFSNPKSKEAREIAKEIIAQMRNGRDEPLNLKISYSAYDQSDSPRNSFDDSILFMYPSPTSIESSFNREAKKRLSERWNMTQKNQDLRIPEKCSTLSEMLSLPDSQTSPKPSGISSRDGWKSTKINTTLPRTKSLPPSDASFEIQREVYVKDRSGQQPMFQDHSPVSVLEGPFTEDMLSSSEIFESVRAEIHELRMKLRLLNDIGWEVCYALDVLMASGLEDSGFDFLHAPFYPLDPGLFHKLEKKYGRAGLKSERKLLFDAINSSLLEIFQQEIDLCPSVMPNVVGFYHSTSRKKGVRDALVKLIKRDFANVEIPERVLDREMRWSDCRGQIDMIGIEIERLVIDDMIAEVIVCN